MAIKVSVKPMWNYGDNPIALNQAKLTTSCLRTIAQVNFFFYNLNKNTYGLQDGTGQAIACAIALIKHYSHVTLY